MNRNRGRILVAINKKDEIRNALKIIISQISITIENVMGDVN
ncbi:MAG: hypothetical protein ABIN18_09970 [Pseudomonadota bacterium]